MTRLARAAAESLATESGTDLSVALGSLPPSHGTPRQLAAILTHRELSVLRFLPSHLTYAEIARECIMSVNTVKTHLKRIYATGSLLPRGNGRACPPARPAVTRNTQPVRILLRRPRAMRQGIQPAQAFRITITREGIVNTTTPSAPASPGGTGTPGHVLAPRRRTWARRAGT